MMFKTTATSQAGCKSRAAHARSTATVLQLLKEHRELTTRFGRVSLAVLIFQDLSVVPLLALLPLLNQKGTALLVALGLALAKS